MSSLGTNAASHRISMLRSPIPALPITHTCPTRVPTFRKSRISLTSSWEEPLHHQFINWHLVPDASITFLVLCHPPTSSFNHNAMSPSTPAFAPAAAPLLSSFRGATLRHVCNTPAPVASPARSRFTMAFSSIDRVLTRDPVSMPSDTSDVVAAVYAQVLGNAYLMESERAELATAESEFRRSGDVRSFVRALALSEAYKSRFFWPVSQYRFVELAFKHLLGRAPSSKAEYAAVMALYHTTGYEACIDGFVSSEEYKEVFGDYIVPYGPYKGCWMTNETFNRSVAMRLTPSSSDKGRNAMLQYAVCADGSPSWLSIAKALPPGTEKGSGFTIGGHWMSSQRNKRSAVRVGTKIPGGVVFY